MYSGAILEHRIGHQKYKQPVTGKPLKGFRLNCPRTLYCTEQSHLPNSLNVSDSISGGKRKLLEMTHRETLYGNSELETVKLLKKENFRSKVTEKYEKPRFFRQLKAWWTDYHLYFTWKSTPCSRLESSCFRNQSVKNARNDQLKIFSPRKNANFHILGVNKDSPFLSKDFRVYWLTHLLKNLNVPNRSQQEKNEIFKSDITKRNLATLNLKRSTCSIWESFQRTVLQGKNGSPGKNGYRKHGWVVIRTDEGAGSTVGAGGKMYLLAAQEKHVSKRFDRSGYFQESG